MTTRTFNVSREKKLSIGYQYDHNALTIKFTGFVVDADTTVYLKLEDPVNAMIPLTDDLEWVVQSNVTAEVGSIKSQLCEYQVADTSDDTDETVTGTMKLIKASPIFYCTVAESITEQTEVTDPSLNLIYAQMEKAYKELLVHEETASASAEAAAKSATESATHASESAEYATESANHATESANYATESKSWEEKAEQVANTKGYIYVEGGDDGILYAYTSDGFDEDIKLIDDGNGNLEVELQ